MAGKNVPGAADPWGGCWPGPGNTGVPSGITLTAYTGPCTITVAGTVIDSKTVNCDLDIQASGVVIQNSVINGNLNDGDANDSNPAFAGASFLITDSKVSNGARDDVACQCVGTHNFVMTRVEVVGGNRSGYCQSHCTVTDSWTHGQLLTGAQHASGMREQQFGTFTHNSLSCDWPHPNDTTSQGCSADLTGYPDFAPIHDNQVKRNLFVSNTRDPNNVNPAGPGATVGVCMFGGATGGKPFSSDPANATNQVFVENVFMRGITGKCGDWDGSPTAAVDLTRSGNLFQGNVFDDGSPVTPDM